MIIPLNYFPSSSITFKDENETVIKNNTFGEAKMTTKKFKRNGQLMEVIYQKN
ncbi:unnamed protein product [Meloidogyne enterolobii]|uniref:Uncharacterized protein n=1 Tax=Meloidogyne enterolobii TaxID=390850 RepID=A0ACB1AIJ8_MELEN